MHPYLIPNDVAERVIRRRGRLHVFDYFEPSATALVVIDMQNAFCEPGRPLYVPDSTHVVPRINEMANALRDAGGLVVWVQTIIEKHAEWSMYLDHMVAKNRVDDVLADLSMRGSGYRLWPELALREDDMFAAKTRFSAFLPSSSDLEHKLRERGIENVLIAGTLTNVCCESSARDASMQDFRTVMLSNANSCRTDEEHMGALCNFIQSFGDVLTVEEAIARLSASSLGI